MPREPVEPIDEPARRLIRAALRRKGLNQSGLARRVGVHRSAINRILKGKGGATVSTLRALAEILDIPPHRLRVQYEFEFEITEEFASAAQKALAEELSRLGTEIGTIRAIRVTGTVGVRFHGLAPEERVFERVFAFAAPRKLRRGVSNR